MWDTEATRGLGRQGWVSRRPCPKSSGQVNTLSRWELYLSYVGGSGSAQEEAREGFLGGGKTRGAKRGAEQGMGRGRRRCCS